MPLWLRHEVFEQSAELPPRLLEALTLESVHAVTAAVRAAPGGEQSPREAFERAAQEQLGWGEQPAELFWATLRLLVRLGRGATGEGAGALEELSAGDVGLFLFAHLLSKRDSVRAPNPHALQKFNAAWPEEPEEPEAPEAPAGAAAPPTTPPRPSPILVVGVDGAMGPAPSAASGAGAGGAFPASPRSHALYARSSAEAHRLALVRRHLSDLLRLVSEEGQGAQDEERGVTSSEIDALAFLMAGGGSLRSQSASLSSLFRESPEGEALGELARRPAPREAVLAWLQRAITVNEIAYPPPVLASPSARQLAQQEEPETGDGPFPVRAPVVLAALRRTTVVRTCADLPADVSERDLEIHSCHDAVVFVLAPVRFVTVLGCHNCTVVVGAAAGVVSVEHCEGTRVSVSCSRLRVHNSVDCVLCVFSPSPPVVAGDNRGLRFAPHNVAYPALAEHAVAARLAPVASAAHNTAWASATDLEEEENEVSPLPPSEFALISPPSPGGAPPAAPASLAYELPPEYVAGIADRAARVNALRAELAAEEMAPPVRQEMEAAVRAHFWEWLVSTGKIRHVADLVQFDRK